MELAYTVFISLTCFGAMPLLSAHLLRLAIRGEPMGYLLGGLIAFCVCATAFNIPVQYSFFGEHFKAALLSSITGIILTYWILRHAIL